MSRPNMYHTGYFSSWFDSVLGPLNPIRFLPLWQEPAAACILLGAAGGAVYGLTTLYSQYKEDMTKRREEYELEYQKYKDQQEKKQKLQLQKSEKRKAESENKQKQMEEKKAAQQKKIAEQQAKREQEKIEKEKIAEKKKNAEKSPASYAVDNLFNLEEKIVISILTESQQSLFRDVQMVGPLAITGGRNATPAARKVSLRNQSIFTQITAMPLDKLAQLSSILRYEAGMWLAYYTRIRYSDLSSRGLKKAELLRDNEIVLKYLSFSPEELAAFNKQQLTDLYKTILETSLVVDNVNQIDTAYKWLYANCTIEPSTEPAPSQAQIQAQIAAKQNNEIHSTDDEARTLYLSLPVADRQRLQTSLDLFTVIILLPIAPVLGRWSDFRALANDYLVYSPPGPNSGLQELQRSYSSLPHTPNLYALHQMATTFSPTIEDVNSPGIPLKKIDPITADTSDEDKDRINKEIEEDTKARYEAFVTNVKHSLSYDQHQSTPMVETTTDITDLAQLDFKEYHIRTLTLNFNVNKSYHAIRSNLENLGSNTPEREPRTYPPGDKKLFIRGAVACIQDVHNVSSSSNFLFGPRVQGSKDFTFVAETFRSVSRGTVLQSQLFHFTQSEEDKCGRSTLTGYLRVTQTPVDQKEFKPTFSFYFDIKMTLNRVLSPEEKEIADELLAQEILAKAAAEAAAKTEAEAADATNVTEGEKKEEHDVAETSAEVAVEQPLEESAVMVEVPVEESTPLEEAVVEPAPVVEEAVAPVEEEPVTVQETASVEEPVTVQETAPVEEPVTVQETAPAVEEEPVTVQETATVIEEEPVQETATVIEEEPVTVQETATIIEEESATAQETAPAVEEVPVPIIEEPADVVEEPADAVESTPIVEEVATPDTQEVTAVIEEIDVIEEDNSNPVPVVEDAVPIIEEPAEEPVIEEGEIAPDVADDSNTQ